MRQEFINGFLSGVGITSVTFLAYIYLSSLRASHRLQPRAVADKVKEVVMDNAADKEQMKKWNRESIYMTRFANVNQVTLPSKNIKKNGEFWENIMGLKLIVDDHHYKRFECDNSDFASTLSLHNDEGSTAPIVYIEAPSKEALDEKYLFIKQKGIDVTEPVDQSWGWRESHLKDADGNNVILYYAGRWRRYPDWRVESSLPSKPKY